MFFTDKIVPNEDISLPLLTHRWAVAHCHILPHEDEGCVMPVVWKAPTPSGQPQCTAERVGVCPEYYGFAEGIPNADICNLKQPLGLFAPPP